MSEQFRDAELFDFIIVGAGSAGCVLANRLSADPSARVLLLEAGPDLRSIWLTIPAGYMHMIGNPRFDWCFETAIEPGLNHRSIACPRGKAPGGSSIMNGMFQVRGQAADYDHWRQLGLTGWGWSDVLPYFKAHEDFVGGEGPHHGAGGELRVEESRVSWPVLDLVAKAAQEDGLPRLNDFNLGDNEGVGPLHVTQKNGVRWSASRAFLKSALSRSNLRLECEALTQRVLFEGRRAVGVEYRKGGQTRVARARREVVLAAGAINTPQILMLSGIGPAAHLAERGIKVALDKPGVGGNLQDHLQMRVSYRLEGVQTFNQRYNSLFGKIGIALEYAAFRSGPLTMAPTTLGIFAKSNPRRERADIGFNVLPFSRPGCGMNAGFHKFPGLTMIVYDLQPTSRGAIRLKSSEPQAKPDIRFNYLSTEEDQQVAVDAIRVTRRIMRRPALAPYRLQEILPGTTISDDDDAGLLDAFRQNAMTIFHPVGTAKMGLESDPQSVVDARLKLVGMEGLRVADASIMPVVTSGNTNGPTMMIAEKAAAMIRKTHGIDVSFAKHER